MNKFSFARELQSIIDNKSLVELYLKDTADFEVVYILGSANACLVFAVVGSAGDFRGLTVTPWSNITLFKTDTLYLKAFEGKINQKLIWNEIEKSFFLVKSYDLLEWLKQLNQLNKIVAITDQSLNDVAGIITAYDDNLLVLDEYTSEYHTKLAHAYLKINDVQKLTIDAPWLKTIEQIAFNKKMS